MLNLADPCSARNALCFISKQKHRVSPEIHSSCAPCNTSRSTLQAKKWKNFKKITKLISFKVFVRLCLSRLCFFVQIMYNQNSRASFQEAHYHKFSFFPRLKHLNTSRRRPNHSPQQSANCDQQPTTNPTQSPLISTALLSPVDSR